MFVCQRVCLFLSFWVFRNAHMFHMKSSNRTATNSYPSNRFTLWQSYTAMESGPLICVFLTKNTSIRFGDFPASHVLWNQRVPILMPMAPWNPCPPSAGAQGHAGIVVHDSLVLQQLVRATKKNVPKKTMGLWQCFQQKLREWGTDSKDFKRTSTELAIFISVHHYDSHFSNYHIEIWGF